MQLMYTSKHKDQTRRMYTAVNKCQKIWHPSNLAGVRVVVLVVEWGDGAKMEGWRRDGGMEERWRDGGEMGWRDRKSTRLNSSH